MCVCGGGGEGKGEREFVDYWWSAPPNLTEPSDVINKPYLPLALFMTVTSRYSQQLAT